MTRFSFSAFKRPGEDHYQAIKECLQDIFDVAEGYGGQSRHARKLLLSLYDPENYTFSGDNILGLDVPHLHNAIHVLHEYGMCRISIFRLIEDAEKRLLRLATR